MHVSAKGHVADHYGQAVMILFKIRFSKDLITEVSPCVSSCDADSFPFNTVKQSCTSSLKLKIPSHLKNWSCLLTSIFDATFPSISQAK